MFLRILSRSIDAQCSFTDNVSHGSGRSCTADPSPKYQDDQHTPLSQFIPCWGWIPGLCMSKQSALSYSLLSENILKLQFCALPQIYLIRVSGQGPGICSPEAYPGLCMCKQVVDGMGCPVAGGFPHSWVPWTSCLLLVGVQGLLKTPRSLQILLCPHLLLRLPPTPSGNHPMPRISDRLACQSRLPQGWA